MALLLAPVKGKLRILGFELGTMGAGGMYSYPWPHRSLKALGELKGSWEGDR